jgi:hypothetical protein
MALDTTVGGSTSNSYVSLGEANTYFNNHYATAKKAAWTALGSVQREFTLKRACQQLETLRVLDDQIATGRLPVELIIDLGYDVTIHRSEINQRLQFPRNLDLDSTGEPYIPQEIKDAQCEQAVYLLSFDDSPLTTTLQGVIEEAVTAGAVKSYTRYAEGHAPTYLSPMVVELMRPYFRSTSQMKRQ